MRQWRLDRLCESLENAFSLFECSTYPRCERYMPETQMIVARRAKLSGRTASTRSSRTAATRTQRTRRFMGDQEDVAIPLVVTLGRMLRCSEIQVDDDRSTLKVSEEMSYPMCRCCYITFDMAHTCPQKARKDFRVVCERTPFRQDWRCRDERVLRNGHVFGG